MVPMFLTPAQLTELTGYRLPSKQIQWLVHNGVRHWIARTGRPVVPCSAVDGRPASAQDAKPFELGHVA